MHQIRKNPQAMSEVLAKSQSSLGADLALSKVIKSKIDIGLEVTSAARVKSTLPHAIDR